MEGLQSVKGPVGSREDKGKAHTYVEKGRKEGNMVITV